MPAIKREDGKSVVSSTGNGSVAGFVLVACGLGMQGVIVAAYFSGNRVRSSADNDPKSLAIMMAIIALIWIAGIFIAINGKNARYETDDNGLRSYDWLGRLKTEIAWRDVTAFTVTPPNSAQSAPTWRRLFALASRSISVTAGSQEITIPINRYGWPLVEGEICHHLPQFKSPVGVPASQLPRTRPILPSQGMVIRQWMFLFVAVIVGGMGGLLFILPLSVSMNDQPPGGAKNIPIVVMGLIFLLGGISAALYAFNAKTVFTESDVRVFGIFGQLKDQMYWSDIEAFEYETTYSGKNGTTTYYVLRSRDNYIRLSDRNTGWAKMCEMIIALMPAESRIYMPQMEIG